MRKCVCRLAPIAAMALIPMAAMTMPTARSAPCDDGQFWSPHSNACEPLPCPYGASFDQSADVCECHAGMLYNPSRKICESLAIFAPPVLHR
jgi:hypothetical protein